MRHVVLITALLLLALLTLALAGRKEQSAAASVVSRAGTEIRRLARKIPERLRVQPAERPSSGEPAELPEGGSVLPVMSVIGFGALVGGLASALRGK